IGVDAFDADLGEDRGQRREHGGEQRPELPGVWAHEPIPAVIASNPSTLAARASPGGSPPKRLCAKAEAKQSRMDPGEELDCFVAALLAMTEERASIAVFRQHRKRGHLDAFLDQRACFLG